MSLCCEEMIKALQEDETSCKMLPHPEKVSLEKVLEMFSDEKINDITTEK